MDDIQYIAISGDEKDTADFLQRKILVFIRMTKFLFGPVYMEYVLHGRSQGLFSCLSL